MLRPASDIALHRAAMEDWPGREPLREWQEDLSDWVDANDGCRQEILQRLRSEGPLAARDIPDTCVVPWRSSGWKNNRNVQQLLDCMERRGEVAVSSREGRGRLWDLAERIYPDDLAVPEPEARGRPPRPAARRSSASRASRSWSRCCSRPRSWAARAAASSSSRAASRPR